MQTTINLELADKVSKLIAEVNKVVVGQKSVILKCILALLVDGNVLLEGVPGLAKTLIFKTLAASTGGTFKRIQFTPDLLPADITGTRVFNPQTLKFEVVLGPIFANFVLADEINRAPAKVQSALLEGMQEKQVTIGNQSFPLPRPFIVMATQNPIESEGTYPLPEAQLDRFIMKIKIDYPNFNEEKEIIHRMQSNFDLPNVEKVIEINEIIDLQMEVEKVKVSSKIEDYITKIVFITRKPHLYGLNSLSKYIMYGSSPRATLAFIKLSKALAFVEKRQFVIPEDIEYLAFDVLRHRIILTYEAQAESVTTEDIILTIIKSLPKI
ncbi:MAG: MoxR family ATPase [Candidatus Calescibacterium sp.]|nr:MoxR family ATPase [Candidatus Calescibacterium sp.]MDW7973435.1 MoxR family ATPase [Thermodesulfovibrio sp.]MDW8132983.1 MoxR family ATPase [Candidatus Calescibacterium sp.]